MWQMILLISSLQPWLARRYRETGQGGYTGGNMFVYFSPEQVRNHDFRGPDFFAVVGTDPHAERRSWVVWDEGKAPDVVIELMSESTSTFDKTAKKDIYQDRVRVPEYYWFDPYDPDDFAGFALCTGLYKPLERDDRGRLTSTRLGGLQLGTWDGTFHHIETTWLRWYTPEGDLLLTADEAALGRAATEAGRAAQAEQRADVAEQRVDVAEQRADDAEQRAARLASKLRALGIEPDSI